MQATWSKRPARCSNDNRRNKMKQEGQLLQRNSASYRLANWSSNAQNTVESQRLYRYYFLILKRSDSSSAGRKRILTWNSHSRSFKVIHFAFSYRPTRGSISLCNIACRLWSFWRRNHLNRQKLPSSTTPNVVWRTVQDELPRISAWTLYFQKLQSLA